MDKDPTEQEWKWDFRFASSVSEERRGCRGNNSPWQITFSNVVQAATTLPPYALVLRIPPQPIPPKPSRGTASITENTKHTSSHIMSRGFCRDPSAPSQNVIVVCLIRCHKKHFKHNFLLKGLRFLFPSSYCFFLFICLFSYFWYMSTMHQSPRTLKPLSAGAKNIDHLAAVQCSAANLWSEDLCGSHVTQTSNPRCLCRLVPVPWHQHIPKTVYCK